MSFYRGRLLRPFLAEIQRIDTQATTYDPVWRTPVVTYPGGVRTKSTAYQDPILLRAQIEVTADGVQQQTASGNTPDSRIVLVFHFRNLEAAGLVDANGLPMLRVNDRLTRLMRLNGQQLQVYPRPLYATEVQPTGFGLGGGRNLVIATYEDRPEGTQA
ncbi:MAG: hypothetical protein HOW73_43165 [Polyangiaceae bacterium]|nr:hypothetical protein [Polyangiaceae bacterium]